MQIIDSRNGHDTATLLADLRRKLSPSGDVVSTAGREKTLAVFGEPLTPQQSVERICRDVATRGIDAVLDYTKRIDGAALTAETLRVSAAELDAAHKNASPDFLAAIKRIAANIASFQTAIRHHDVRVERVGGSVVEKYRPLRRVGVCVPGGAAAYPSSVLMTVVPAKVAGVSEIAVMAPPTPFGAYSPDVLATCAELGVREVYRMGGAQGVAALAYGVETIPQVDKIVGPGNLFVALAKRHVFGSVAIDSIAGPSEVVVIVDATTNPRFTALDLIAQAEHSPGASIVISWDANALERTLDVLRDECGKLSRGDLAWQSLAEFGAAILVEDADEACRLASWLAPEHLHINTADAASLAEKIDTAGAIFVGPYTPVAAGDYAAGPSHVLPTSGTARFASGLTCNDFLRGHSVITLNRDGLEHIAADIDLIATKEGLTAHRESVRRRIGETASDVTVNFAGNLHPS
ncbi:MAG: histidinol dehydrogenase [Thermoguttaceae bacterium]